MNDVRSFSVPELKPGELWAGIAFVDGKPSHHLVLLPGKTRANWKTALAWAEKQAGALPTRKEQALLFANLPGEFQQDWYWSGEPDASDSSYVWVQYFYGYQGYNHVSYKHRARAVRRVPIQ